MASLADLLKSLNAEQRIAFAKAAGTTRAVLDQYAGGHKVPGYRMAQRLVAAAEKLEYQLSLHDCRPDIWDADRRISTRRSSKAAA